MHIFWNELPDDIYDKTISVYVDEDEKNGFKMKGKVNPDVIKQEIFKMKIPAQFKMDDYMDYIFKAKDGKYQVSIDKQFSEGCRNGGLSQKIQKIYGQLRKNYNR